MLAQMQAARGEVARRARWSIARHAAFGVVMGGLVASYALPGGWTLVGLGACLTGTALIAAWDRRRDGFFVNGYRAGRTRLLALLLCLVALATLGLAVALRTRFGIAWAPLALGALLALLGTGASIAWERLYRGELERARHGD